MNDFRNKKYVLFDRFCMEQAIIETDDDDDTYTHTHEIFFNSQKKNEMRKKKIDKNISTRQKPFEI